MTSYQSKGYEKVLHTTQHQNYTIRANLNAYQILTIHVVDSISKTEWKQQFKQSHFKNNNINDVAKMLINATKPFNIQKRVKIISDPQWCYITIDHGVQLPSFALPNDSNIAALFPYSKTDAQIQPRNYTNDTTIVYDRNGDGEKDIENDDLVNETTAFKTTNQRKNTTKSIVNDNESDSDIDDEKVNVKSFETTSNNNKYHAVGNVNPNKNGNDLLRIGGWCLHLMIIILTLFYCSLSALYGFGQLYKLTLSDFWCDSDDNLTLNDIHKYNSHNGNILGEEYSCLQIEGNVIDYNKLFNIDPSAAYNSIYEYDNINLIYSIIYFVVSGTFMIILLYDICYIMCYLCTDNDKKRKQKQKKKQKKENDKASLCSRLHNCYITYLSTDTTGWVIRKYITELIEILIQSSVLLMYGGFNIFDQSSLIISELPLVIIAFAIIILLNGVINSILWILYISFPKKIFGLPFAYTLFIVDAIFDSLYAIYPFIINGSIDSKSIGIFRVNSVIRFVSSIVPLILLSYSCFRALSQTYYIANKGKTDPRMKSIDYMQQKQYNTKHFSTPSRHSTNPDNFEYNIRGLFIKCHYKDMEDKLNINKSKEVELKKQDCFNRSCLLFWSSVLLIFSCLVSLSVIVDITNSETFCSSFNLNNINDESVINQNIPELVIYDEVCKRKVYKLFDEYPCNCQLVLFENSMMIDSNSTICLIHNNPELLNRYTSIDILENIFKKWTMIIRFWFDQQSSNEHEYIDGCIDTFHDKYYQNITNYHYDSNSLSFDTPEMFNAQYMQLFYIRNLYIKSMKISNQWLDLQYFSVPNTFINAKDLSFKGLSSLPDLKLIYLDSIDGLNDANEDYNDYISYLCNLENSLQSLQIDNSYFPDLNECFINFNALEFLLLSYDYIINVNWDILYLPMLKRLSLYSSNIPVRSLNNQYIDMSNLTGSMLQYVYLGGNAPVCESHNNLNSQTAIDFINYYNACENGCDSNTTNECPIFNNGDGFCQPECNVDYGTCNFDDGDCNQV